MATGSVKLFNPRGFGFLKQDDGGPDIFFFIGEYKKSGLTGEPAVGQRLAFDIEQGDRGPRAIKLTPA